MNWSQLRSKDYEFDYTEKRISSFEKVTTEQVNALFMEVFFENPRRLNLKIHSHKHKNVVETRKTSQELNKAFYKIYETEYGKSLNFVNIDDIEEFKKSHTLHPRNII